MSTITSFDEALDFYPSHKREPRLGLFRRALAFARIFWSALGEGLHASRRYEHLIAHGVPHGEAAARVFDEHYRAR
jgi:hypothetical protein